MLTSAKLSPPPKTADRNENDNWRETSGNDNGNVVNPSSENPLLKRTWKQRWGLKPTTEELAELQARHLKNASEILLERLFVFLSKLPEEKDPEGDDDEDGEENKKPKSKRRSRSATLDTVGGNQRGGAQLNPMPGITLPASAVGWLSSQLCHQELQQHRKRRGGRHNRGHNNHRHQLHPHDDNDNNTDNDDDDLICLEDDEASSSSFVEQQEQVLWMGVAMRDRLKLLKFLLPRATHIRITRDVWPPPEMDDVTSSGNRRKNQNQAATTTTIPAVAAASGGGRRNPKATGRIHPNNGIMDDEGPLLGQDLNCSTISVNSTLTTESMRPRRPTMEAFLRYSHNLQHHPRIDIQRVFPNVQVLVLKEIPPTWIHNLHTVRHSLQVLRVERGSLYNVHGFLFPKLPSASTGTRGKSNNNNDEAGSDTRGTKEEDPLAAPPPQGEEETNFAWEEYRSLTHLKLSHCGIGDVSGILGSSSSNNRRENRIMIPPPLSRLPNLVSLSLSHNELRSERCALAGLSALPNLAKLDLSYNCLLGLETAYTRLGQIQKLCLSNNRLTSAKGIDRLYALQELLLDHNQIACFADVVGLGRLPELTVLALHGNPLEQENPDGYRVDVLNAFREQRVRDSEELQSMTFRQLKQTLPVLDGKMASNDELRAMRDRTFQTPVMTISQQQADGACTTVPAAGVESTTMPSKFATGKSDEPPTVKSHEESAVDIEVHVVLDDARDAGRQAAEDRNLSLLQGPIRHRRVTRGRPSRKARIDNDDGFNDVAAVASTSTPSLPRRRRNHRKSDSNGKIKNDNAPSSSGASPLVVAFTVQDVLQSLSPQKVKRPVAEEAEPDFTAYDNVGDQDQVTILGVSPHSGHTSIEKSRTTGEGQGNSDTRLDTIEKSSSALEFTGDGNHDSTTGGYSSENEQTDGSKSEVYSGREISETLYVDTLGKTYTNADKEGPGFKTGEYETALTGSAFAGGTTETVESRRIAKTDKTKTKPKVAMVRLFPGATGTMELDIFSQDWDDLVQIAAAGLIPDGVARNPIAELEKQESKRGAVFSTDAINLLPPPGPTTTVPELNTSIEAYAQATLSTASGASQPASSFRPEPLPEHVWQDDSSVPSSLGTTRDDFPSLNKFQLAEENLEYDGPEYSRDWPVLSNLQLYFNAFVFPGDSFAASIPDSSTSYDDLPDDDNWQVVTMKYPRIQLWREDRRWLENASISKTGQASGDESVSCERLVRVWEEEIIPCGKPTLRRLLPNRRARLGFHGDLLFQEGSPDTFSACRKVILCLSSAAFYVIVSEDNAASKLQAKKRKFPIPFSGDNKFQDAKWPHAVTRHSFQDLQGITIGFGFQRLTLRFSNPALRNTDPFTYVLLTSNKTQTVSILQELQRRASYATESESTNEKLLSVRSEEETLHIDNDDRGLLDAVAIAVAPDVLGDVLHYQIVQQKWKHGERGAVRRVFIVTDTKLFLLDEDYAGDGSKPQHGGNSQQRFGDVRYSMVDEASLKQIAEVQAAGVDPGAITIVINPLSRLGRTHRWRLLCRDGDGAERLVEDVRKAIDMAE